MDYLTTNEVALKWNISSRMVAYHCKAGRISGAIKRGKTWLVPVDAEKPIDGRSCGNKIKSKKVCGMPYMGSDCTLNGTYRTSDVASNLGLTREALRYYEEIGLITPKRSAESRYREFDVYDMARLMAIDFFKKRGFAPNEIIGFQSAEAKDYTEIIQDKIISINQKIQCLTEMVNRLEITKEFCRYAAQDKMEFSIEELPVYYVEDTISSVASFDEYRDKVLAYLNLEQEDILSNMVRVMTFDESGYITSGMCIVKPFHGERQNGQKDFLESGKCLHTSFVMDNNDESIVEKMFILCHKWAKQNNLSFRGVVYIFVRLVIFGEPTDKHCYEVWIPLK